MQHQASALPFSHCWARMCHWAAAVPSSQHSPSPPRLTAQGAGLPGSPASSPVSLCPISWAVKGASPRVSGCAGSQGCPLQSAPQPSKHPGLKMMGLPLCLSSQLFSEGVQECREVPQLCSPAWVSSLLSALGLTALQACQCCSHKRAGLRLPFSQLGQGMGQGTPRLAL